MKSTTRLVIGLGVLIGIIAIFSLYLGWPLITGKTIVLATVPVDPFDPLRGQYVTIRYDISTINTSAVSASVGDSVYVSLLPDTNGIWRQTTVSKTMPTQGIFVGGKVTNAWSGHYSIEYGIEQYFFERNAHVETRNGTVVVKVDTSGRSRIVELRSDGKPAIKEYRNASIYS